MKQIGILAPAKINLFLKILDKRPDGFHNIETVFEKISLCDKIILQEINSDKILIKSNIKSPLFLSKENTIYKAIYLIKEKFKIKNGIYAYIEKNIPIKAGLGGGSSDAAAVLKGLNNFWKLGLSQKDLIELSTKIGSDAALFLVNGSFLLGREKGEKVSIIKGTKKLKLWHILIVPRFGVSTPFAYALYDKYYLNQQGKMRLTIPAYNANIITYALSKRDVSLLNYHSYNSFEDIILKKFPDLAGLKVKLQYVNQGSVYMSGSGSALFATFSNRKEAEKLSGKAKKIIGECSCLLVSTLLHS